MITMSEIDVEISPNRIIDLQNNVELESQFIKEISKITNQFYFRITLKKLLIFVWIDSDSEKYLIPEALHLIIN